MLTPNMVKFGILGAARIAPKALIGPARNLASVEITRVACRDRSRAVTFATEHDIKNVSDSYQSLIESPDVDVVYNPLPMHLHAQWTIAALRAGKHVLCEKPFASNAAEAAEMVRVAHAENRVLGEAFHHRYHPMFEHILRIVHAGVIGDVTHVAGYFSITVQQPDIRWNYETSGGSLMDLGCYLVSWVRHLVGEEPAITKADATIGAPHIDAAIRAQMRFPGGATGHIESSMILPSDAPADVRLEVTGTKGSLTAINPLAPQKGNSLTIRTNNGETTSEIVGGDTYTHMLRRFCDHIVHGTEFPTKGTDSIRNMAAIDAIYAAAGLPVRGDATVTSI